MMWKWSRDCAVALCWLGLSLPGGCFDGEGDDGESDDHGDDHSGEQGDDHGGEHDAAAHADAGSDAGDESEDEDTPCTPDYPAFHEGLSASAEGLTVRLVSVEPNPPRQKVENDWVIEVTGADGMPAAQASVQGADSYMVVHNHYGRRKPTIEQLDQPGRFKLDNIDFRMRGPWQLILNVKTADANSVSPALQICVE